MAAAPAPTLVPLSIGKYAVVRFLGTDADVDRFIVRAEAGGSAATRLVLERVSRASVEAADFDAFTRRARRIAMLRHPHVPRVRDVYTTQDHAVIVTEFIEGLTWTELDARAKTQGKKPLSFEGRLKLIVDAVAGLAALHALRESSTNAEDTGKVVPSMIHGDVTPSGILVGVDGLARLLRLHRRPLRPPSGPLDERSARSAPEILLGDGTADGRADVYSLGAILWETLAGRPLFTQRTVTEMLSRQLSGDMPLAPSPASTPWAALLVEIAAMALAVDPKRRYPTVTDFGVALRNIAAHHLPGDADVAREVRDIVGIRENEEEAPITTAVTTRPQPPHGAAAGSVTDLDSIDERWSKAPSSLPPAGLVPAPPLQPLPTGAALHRTVRMTPPPVPSPRAAQAAPRSAPQTAMQPVQTATRPAQAAVPPPPPAVNRVEVQAAPMSAPSTPSAMQVPRAAIPPPPSFMSQAAAQTPSGPIAPAGTPPPSYRELEGKSGAAFGATSGPPSFGRTRTSEITALKDRPAWRRRRLMILLALLILFVSVTVCSLTLLLRSPKTSGEVAAGTPSAKAAGQAAEPPPVALSKSNTSQGTSAKEPAPIPAPPPPSQALAASPAEPRTARAHGGTAAAASESEEAFPSPLPTSATPAAPAKPAETPAPVKPAQASVAPSRPSAAQTPTSRASSSGTSSAAAPRSKHHKVYVPLGI